MFQFHPYAAVLAVSALTALATSIIILRRDVPGSRLLGGVLLSIFVWSGAYAMSWSLAGLHEKTLWLKIMYLGTATIPGLFLVFILRITHNDDRLTPRNLLLLALEPFIIIVLTWFDLRLMFNKIELDLSSGVAILHLERGIGFWVNLYYSYGIVLLAFYILGVSSLRANPFFRRQYLIILIGSIIDRRASCRERVYSSV